ncbi:MAG: TetR/AcrR family transcriptional regulator [Gammaproteobacteria bacterium]|nr:TetR/AcrR family transcriptional regulator [Gammaproteobacteria bacterium]MCK5092382.1 TetR/AcrR family transcriptional regulator [Gammaproteobacteria bacterium]
MAKRLKAAERKASILAVSKILFADKGFHGVSVDEIAQRLGVSPAVLYKHFDSKEALYEAVLDEISCKRESYVEAVVQQPMDFARVLEAMTRVYVESIAKDPDYLKMEMHSVLEGSAVTKQFFENRWRSFTDYIEFNMQELMPKEKVANINPKVASLMFQGMIREALYAKCIYHSDRYREIDLQTLVTTLTGLFLVAIGYQQHTNIS